MKRSALFMAIGLAFSFATGGVFAKDDDANLSKLGAFKRTDTGPMKRVPQGGQYAENLKKMLQQIKLPDGLQDRAVRHRARCARHGGEPQHGHGVGRNPQEHRLFRQ